MTELSNEAKIVLDLVFGCLVVAGIYEYYLRTGFQKIPRLTLYPELKQWWRKVTGRA